MTIQQNESIRTARKDLATRIRQDWKFPSLCELYNRVDGEISVTQETDCRDEIANESDEIRDNRAQALHEYLDRRPPRALTFEATDFREREYSSHDSDASTITSKSPSGGVIITIAESTNDKKMQRKYKREESLNEEMDWNNGLAHFVAQRNVWTCAQSGSNMTTSDTLTSPTVSPHSSRNHLPIPKSLAETLEPARLKVSPRAYPELYQMVILGSRTPPFPVNLLHVTRAMVKGMQDDDNWPPRSLGPKELDPLVGRRKRKKVDTEEGGEVKK